MTHKLWHKLFGYKCPNCGGGGMDMCAVSGWTCGCYVCKGKGRVRNKPNLEDYNYGIQYERCVFCRKEEQK